ncbi:MAG: SBBP repeat-containing protein, partial [Methanomassiliicoccales archaeon]
MFRLILKTFFLFILLIYLSLQASESPELLIQDQILQEMKTQDISKSLKISSHYGQIPLYFIPNEGQVDEKALYYAKASRYTLWLTKEGLVFDSNRRLKKDHDRFHHNHSVRGGNPEDFTLERDVSRMFFLNANKEPEVVPIDQTEHGVNYFIGNDKSKWRTNIQTSKAVLYKELYRKVDLKVHGKEKQIEYDFVVKPGGEVADINFEYKDVEETRIDKNGNLIIETKFGELMHAKPVCYQMIEGGRVEIEAGFKETREKTYAFRVDNYNKKFVLIIDPMIWAYSTYFGGSDNDGANDIAVDSEGAIYITGSTESFDFPVTANAFQPTLNGGPAQQPLDAFVARLR